MGKADIVFYSLAKLGASYKIMANITLGELASKGSDGSEPTPVDMVLAAKIQQMRDLLGKPVHINSVYRTVKHNASVGGVAGSYHTQGMAADIWFGDTFADRIPDEEAAQCAEYVGFGGIGLYPGRIHVDTRPGRYRYRKPGKDYITVAGFPGYALPVAPEPEPVVDPATAESVPVELLCRCGGLIATVEGIRLDGSIYAPVRQLCESLGHTVEWTGDKVIVK